MASAYTSLAKEGYPPFSASSSPERSSGAIQRKVPRADTLCESVPVLCKTDTRPKSVRRAFPPASIRTLPWSRAYKVRYPTFVNRTHCFDVSVYKVEGMHILQTVDNLLDLQGRQHQQRNVFVRGQTNNHHAVCLGVGLQVLRNCSVWHPQADDAHFEHLRDTEELDNI